MNKINNETLYVQTRTGTRTRVRTMGPGQCRSRDQDWDQAHQNLNWYQDQNQNWYQDHTGTRTVPAPEAEPKLEAGLPLSLEP